MARWNNRLLNVLMSSVLITIWICIWGHGKDQSAMQEKRSLNAGLKDHLTENDRFKADYKAIDEIIEVARHINSTPVMITFVNDAYLPLVYNWLCNTIAMNIHQKVLMITTSQETKNKIKKIYPNMAIGVIELSEDLKKHQSYSEVGYLKLMSIRTRIITSFILANIETFQFECDSLWIRNPIQMLHSYKNKYDAIFTKVHGYDEQVNGGFLYIFPTKNTKTLFTEVRSLMNSLENRIRYRSQTDKVSEGDNDQVYLSRLLNMNFAGVKRLVLNYSDFADGNWYTFPASKRELLKPYMIHNNFIVGNRAKIERLQKWRHWFLTNDSKCDSEHLQYVLGKFH